MVCMQKNTRIGNATWNNQGGWEEGSKTQLRRSVLRSEKISTSIEHVYICVCVGWADGRDHEMIVDDKCETGESSKRLEIFSSRTINEYVVEQSCDHMMDT